VRSEKGVVALPDAEHMVKARPVALAGIVVGIHTCPGAAVAAVVRKYSVHVDRGLRETPPMPANSTVAYDI
jgi:hypothetical protein